MKDSKDLIVLDEGLRNYAGNPAWEGIAWITPEAAEVRGAAMAEYELELEARWATRNREMWLATLPKRYQGYSFDTLEHHEGNAEAIDAAQNLAPGTNLFIWGDAGNGKTHLSVALGHALVGAKQVAFYGVVELFNRIRRAVGGRDIAPDLERPDVLILDDLGKVKPTDFVYQEFYGTLEHRWANEKTTIFTANHRASAAARQLAPDEESAAAILSRMAAGGVVEVKGADHRLQALAAKGQA